MSAVTTPAPGSAGRPVQRSAFADAFHDWEEIRPKVDLVGEDGNPMDTPWHRDCMNLLIEQVRSAFRDRNDYFVGGAMFVYYSTEQARNKDYRGPDFFFVRGVDGTRPRRYWAIWEERALPDVVVELASPTTRTEDETTKFAISRDTFRTPEYFIYDPDAPDGPDLRGWRRTDRGVYSQLRPDATGRLRASSWTCGWASGTGGTTTSRETGCGYSTNRGGRSPTFAETEAARADAAEAQAAIDRQQADAEHRRANAAESQADAERQRGRRPRRRTRPPPRLAQQPLPSGDRPVIPFQPDRRTLLRVGSAGLLGLAAPPFAAASGKRKAKCKAVIFLHQWGGPGQHETFDPKPDAPKEVRGSFKAIATKVPGLRVGELLPRTAEVADTFCLVRCVQHAMKNHNSAGYYSLTGFAPATDDQRLRDSVELFPAYGSVVDRFAPAPKGIPTFVSYPHVISDGSVTPGQHASFLGKVHNPFFFKRDPNAGDFTLPELSLPASVSPERLASRKDLLKIIDDQSGLLESSAVAKGMDESYQKAVSMLTSKEFKKAFDLGAEKPEVRDRYGRTTYGQGCLLARRLVEAGAKFVNVYFSESIGGTRGGWDTHGFNGNPQDPILRTTCCRSPTRRSRR